MSASVRLMRGVSSGWASIVIIAVTQIYQVRIARRELSEAEFALFGVLSNLVAAFLIAEVGVRASFSRLLLDARNEGGEAYRRFWASAALVFRVQGLAIGLLALACTPFLGGWFQVAEPQLATARAVFLLLGGISALGYAFGHHSVSLLATQHFVVPNFVNILAGVAGFGAFFLGIRNGYGLYAYVFSVVPHLFAACVVFPLITKRLKIAPAAGLRDVSRGEIRRIFVLGFDLFWVALYNLILGHTLLLYGGFLLSAAEIAILTVNLKFVQFGLQVAQRIPGTAEPVLAQMVTVQDFARFRPSWLLAAKGALGCTILGTGILYLWAGFAVGHWTSPADQMSHWPLLMVCLLPLRYIVHTVCVLACTIFKAANQLRFALAWELVLYTALAFPLGRAFGVGGLLAANIFSLLGGSLIPGLRLVRRLGQFPPGVVPGAIARTLLPGFALLFVVAGLVPHPESIALLQRCILTLGWAGAAVGLVWFAGLDGAERVSIRGKIALFRRPA